MKTDPYDTAPAGFIRNGRGHIVRAPRRETREINDLKAKNESLEARLAALEALLSAQNAENTETN